jgi:hypothetical protein
VGGKNRDSHEGIGDIDFGQIDWPVACVRLLEEAEDSVECETELEGVRRKSLRLLVDEGEGVIDDEAIPAIVLWYDSGRRQAKPQEMPDGIVRDDEPLSGFHHVREFLPEKIAAVGCALMGSTQDRGIEIGVVPFGAG